MIFKACFLMFIFVSVSFAYTGQESAKECAICHYEWMDSFIYDLKGTELVDYQKERVVASERICFSCHDGTVVDSRERVWANDKHKINIFPPKGISIPSNLPLENGKIQCKTCHTAHGTGDPKEQGIERSVFLRIPNENSELCKSCHVDKTGKFNHPNSKIKYKLSDNFYTTGGVLSKNSEVICESCHTPHGPKEKKLLLGHIEDSDICSHCHTEKLDKNRNYKKGILNHPVNVSLKDEDKAENMKRSGGIFYGQNEVICLTCHNTHKGMTKELLIMNNKNDNLCLTCHEKSSVNNTKHNLKNTTFKNKFGQSPNEYGVCSSCHAPHGWGLNLPEGRMDIISKACFSCHMNKDIVKNKTIDKNRYNHPINVRPKNINDNLPLFEKTQAYFSEFYKTSKADFVTCATCHNSHLDTKNFLRESILNDKLCLECHVDKKEIMDSKHYGKDLTCLNCHNIHNSDTKNLVNNNICEKCHSRGEMAEKKLTGKFTHPVNMTPKLEVPENFKLFDGKLLCSSCHNPHNKGKNEKFLRFEPEEKSLFCISCHIDKEQIKHTPHDINENKTCENCHNVHNAKTPNFLMKLQYEYKDPSDYCTVCHNPSGVAKQKTVKMIHPDEKKRKHKVLDNIKYISCVSCHDPHKNGGKKGEDAPFDKSFLRNPKEEFCISCHNDKKDFGKSKHNINNYKHSTPYIKKLKQEGDICGYCHDIHSEKTSKPKNIADLCQRCHTDNNLVGDTQIYTSHPEALTTDYDTTLFKSQDKVVCKTCHEPHSANPKLFPKIFTDMDELCMDCHKNKKDVLDSEHNMNIVFDETAHSVCKECHKPHNYPAENRYLFEKKVDEKTDFIRQFCFKCHSQTGKAKSKHVTIFGHPEIPMTFKRNSKVDVSLFETNGQKSPFGNITCSTCHESHRWGEKMENRYTSKNIEGNIINSFLKFSSIIDLCNTCHGKEGLVRYKYYHTEKYRNKSKLHKTSNPEKKKKTLLELLLGE